MFSPVGKVRTRRLGALRTSLRESLHWPSNAESGDVPAVIPAPSAITPGWPMRDARVLAQYFLTISPRINRPPRPSRPSRGSPGPGRASPTSAATATTCSGLGYGPLSARSGDLHGRAGRGLRSAPDNSPDLQGLVVAWSCGGRSALCSAGWARRPSTGCRRSETGSAALVPPPQAGTQHFGNPGTEVQEGTVAAWTAVAGRIPSPMTTNSVAVDRPCAYSQDFGRREPRWRNASSALRIAN